MHQTRIPPLTRLFFPGIISRLPVAGKNIVYLTFDDGPNLETTPFIIDTLNKYGIKATFFCVGEQVKKYPELFARLQENGHIIGNHSMTHINGWKVQTESYIKDVNACNDVFQSVLFRPPYGKITRRQFGILKQQYKIVLWDVLVPDYEYTETAEQCFTIFKKKVRQGSIIVLHDNVKAKNKLASLLPGILHYLIQQKFDIQCVVADK